MISPGSRALRWQAICLLVLAGGVLAVATEEEAPAKGGLQSARRDYEALKAAEARGLRQKAAPKAEMPVLDAAPPSVIELLPKTTKRRTDTSRTDPRQREKSSNWLLEAMRDETEPPATDIEKTLEQTTEPDRKIEKGDLVETALALEKQEAAQRKTSDERRERIERNRDASGLNPLDSFMASWMSAKDLELLGRAPTGAQPSPGMVDLLQSGPPVSSESAAASTPSILSGPGLDNANSPTAFTSFAPERVNPYLENLSGFAPAASVANPSAPTLAPALSEFAAPVPQGTEPAPVPARPESPSERFRAQDDSRYFKQLKRF